jgi:hypothetical protein
VVRDDISRETHAGGAGGGCRSHRIPERWPEPPGRGGADEDALDLERTLSHNTDDVVFASPTVVTRYGEPSGVLRGKVALRAHFRRGLDTSGPASGSP